MSFNLRHLRYLVATAELGQVSRAAIEGRRLETADLTEDIPPTDVGFVWRRNAVFSPQMTAFRDYFRGLFSAPQLARA